jgi:hypothetical protein
MPLLTALSWPINYMYSQTSNAREETPYPSLIVRPFTATKLEVRHIA